MLIANKNQHLIKYIGCLQKSNIYFTKTLSVVVCVTVLTPTTMYVNHVSGTTLGLQNCHFAPNCGTFYRLTASLYCCVYLKNVFELQYFVLAEVEKAV